MQLYIYIVWDSLMIVLKVRQESRNVSEGWILSLDFGVDYYSPIIYIIYMCVLIELEVKKDVDVGSSAW